MPDPTNPTQSFIVQPASSTPPGFMAAVQSAGAWAGSIAAIAALVALMVRLLTREVGRDVARVERDVADVKRTADQAAADVKQLASDRAADVQRIVRLETAIPAIERTTNRIEETLDRNFTELASSIREIRNVHPRGAA